MATTDGISKNQAALKKAYADLLDARPKMVEAAKAFFDAELRRNVMVDSLITGLMNHLHEFARNETLHANEIRSGSPTGDFPGYADALVVSLALGFQNLERLLKGSPPPPPNTKKPGGSTPTQK